MKHPVEKVECLACGHTDYRMTTKPVGRSPLKQLP